MQINISGQHIEVTPALKDYVLAKLERIGKHFDNITNVQVTLNVEKNRHTAEASLHLAGGDIFANAETEDLYAAIDLLADKLDRQVIKHKEKFVERMQGTTSR